MLLLRDKSQNYKRVYFTIQIFGHISGAHFNPSVTIAACIAGKLQLILAPLYVAAQFLGAFAGYGILSVSFFNDNSKEEVDFEVETRIFVVVADWYRHERILCYGAIYANHKHPSKFLINVTIRFD